MVFFVTFDTRYGDCLLIYNGNFLQDETIASLHLDFTDRTLDMHFNPFPITSF